MHSAFSFGKTPRQVLCLGAHCDDIEIGAGATLRQLSDAYPDLRFRWIVFSSDDVREAETRACAARIVDPTRLEIDVLKFRNGYFPTILDAIKDRFEALKNDVAPDLILTHYRHDRHQDHRTVSDLTWNTFRDHTILEYEILKYDGDIGQPNLYVPVSDAARAAKIDALMDAFKSQRHRPWFDRAAFDGLMRIRGVECAAQTGYAEAFYVRKMRLLA